MKFSAFRKSKSDEKVATDEPIIHQSVPDEILYPDGKPEANRDISWFDSVPVGESAKPEKKEVFVSSQRKTPLTPTGKPTAPMAPPVASVAAIAEAAPNGTASARPSHPVGWLVVVEGPGVGQWFVLENGTSHIGQGADQTVCLDFGDNTVAAERHAALTYDEKCHGFVLHADKADGLRLNGMPITVRSTLRDGDVFSVGQTSLRLVALCSPNFHWA